MHLYMKKPRYLLFILLNTISICAICQTANLKFEHIGTEAGLSQSNVTCLLEDSRGFMSFGTRDGLDKYDGYQFTVYKRIEGDQKSISNNFITGLIEDKKGDLWVATWGGGLNRFDREKNRFIHHAGGILSEIINNVLQDTRGRFDSGGEFYPFRNESAALACSWRSVLRSGRPSPTTPASGCRARCAP